MVRPLRGVIVLIAVATLVALVSTVGLRMLGKTVGAGPDRQAYNAYVNRYIGGWWSSADPMGHVRDKQWAGSHPKALLVEGDKACGWLLGQPLAPSVDPTGNSTVGALSTRFVRETRGDHPAELSSPGLDTIAAGAWKYLCRADRDVRIAPKTLDED